MKTYHINYSAENTVRVILIDDNLKTLCVDIDASEATDIERYCVLWINGQITTEEFERAWIKLWMLMELEILLEEIKLRIHEEFLALQYEISRKAKRASYSLRLKTIDSAPTTSIALQLLFI